MRKHQERLPPARSDIDCPCCPKCGSKMWLALIAPDQPDHDLRVFQCPDCDHLESRVVRFR
jgi:hypothetical protein